MVSKNSDSNRNFLSRFVVINVFNVYTVYLVKSVSLKLHNDNTYLVVVSRIGI